MLVPTEPKIYHIVHMDRLTSIIAYGGLWCDGKMTGRESTGTTIGMSNIKQRRLTNELNSHRNLHVGDCVPFYFCPRPVMLYVIFMKNHPELAYRGGQEPILHLEADLHQVVSWAQTNNRRWVFTSSNAGNSYFEDYSDLNLLNKLDWQAIHARDWRTCREEKQAEFLMESSFPWDLISRIGVHSATVRNRVARIIRASSHQPPVEIKPDWYYGT